MLRSMKPSVTPGETLLAEYLKPLGMGELRRVLDHGASRR